MKVTVSMLTLKILSWLAAAISVPLSSMNRRVWSTAQMFSSP